MKILLTTIAFSVLAHSACASAPGLPVPVTNFPAKAPIQQEKVTPELAVDLAPNKTTEPVKAANVAPIAKADFATNVKISNEWLRQPSSTSKNTAAYFKINNNTDKNIIINSLETEDGICDRTEMHGYKNEEGNVKKMYKLESITVPAKTEIEFAPGGFHVMLLSLKKPIMKDSNIKITLKMSPADPNSKEIIPDTTINFPVK